MANDSQIRPINTPADYEKAIARVEQLMSTETTGSELDEIEVLSILIKRYEDAAFPMDAPSPIEAILFRMEQMGLSQRDLVPYIGSRAKVSEVLNGKRDLTLKMIRALHQHLGIPAESLIGGSGMVPPALDGIDPERLPLAEMMKRGWIGKVRDWKDSAEEIVRELIEASGGQQALPQALFRQGTGARANANMDVNALQAWCLHVLKEARRAEPAGAYVAGSINQSFLRELAKLSVFDDGPKRAQEKLGQNGIALVFAAHLPKTHLDGAALWTIEGTPVVGITVRYDRLDNFWFCLLHELAHLGRHFPEGPHGIIVDDLDLRSKNGDRDDDREREADAWAQNALIPDELWTAHPARFEPTVPNTLSLAQQAGVHPAIIAGRIRYENRNYRLLSQFVGSGEIGKLLERDDF